MPDLPLNKSAADRAVAIFNNLRIPDVAGTPLLKDAAGEWFRDIVRAVHGSLTPDGRRNLTEVFALAPKKSAKTTYSAALLVTTALMNTRPRAELLMIAPMQETADLAFRQAAGMIELDPVLAAKFHIREHLKTIVYRPTKAHLKIRSMDPAAVTGIKPVFILLDELHVIAESPNADRVLGQLRGGMIANPEAFMLTITTQSERPPRGVFKAELQKARKVRDGDADAPAGLLPVLYEFPPGVDWKDPGNWHMVNPNAGRSVTIERLMNDYAGAVSSGDDEVRRWVSQHLNVQVGVATKDDGWAGAAFWEPNADPTLTLDTILARSEVIVVGIDGGGLDDLLGLAVLGRCRETRKWLLWTHAWAHPIAMERRKSEASRYRDFEKAGDLTFVAQLPDDISGAVDIVARIKDAGLLGGVGLDQIGLGGIVDALAEIDVTQDNGLVFGVSQGYKLQDVIKTCERKLADGSLVHAGQPLMAFCVANAKVEPRGNSIIITKQAAGTAKIDPLVASFNAAQIMVRNPQAQVTIPADYDIPVWTFGSNTAAEEATDA